MEGDRAGFLAALPQARRGQKEGEAAFYMTRVLAQLGEREQAITGRVEAADNGFVCAPAYERDPFDAGLLRHGLRFHFATVPSRLPLRP